jgi:hypothetical protein
VERDGGAGAVTHQERMVEPAPAAPSGDLARGTAVPAI